jgi:hypothetical protein
MTGRPWLYEVANLHREPDGTFKANERDQFALQILEITDPVWFANGNGAFKISAEDRDKLNRAIREKPPSNDEYQLLLAEVNRRVGSDDENGVSPWCQTCFLPASGIGAQAMDHRKSDEPLFNDQRPTPMLYWGMDFTDIASYLAQMHRLVEEGKGPGDPVYDALLAANPGPGIQPRS